MVLTKEMEKLKHPFTIIFTTVSLILLIVLGSGSSGVALIVFFGILLLTPLPVLPAVIATHVIVTIALLS